MLNYGVPGLDRALLRGRLDSPRLDLAVIDMGLCELRWVRRPSLHPFTSHCSHLRYRCGGGEVEPNVDIIVEFHSEVSVTLIAGGG